MAYKPHSLFRLIQDMNKSVFLPHIQRPFVWTEDQMYKLFDSLMRNYPIQTFLFWKTKDAIKARKFMQCLEWDADLSDYYDNVASKEGFEKIFVLDGQQRLQSLFVLFQGSIKSDDGRQCEVFVDMTGGDQLTEEGLLYQVVFSDTHINDPKYYRLCDLLGKHSQKNAEDIADELNETLDNISTEPTEQRRARERRVRKNCGQLVSLLREERHFWIEELDGVASEFPYKKVLEIFIRVNSGGTKLEAADLMFAAMKEEWGEIEENVENVVELLNNGKLSFDKSFVLKCLLVGNNKGAQLTPEKFSGPIAKEILSEIKSNWETAEKAFQQLRDFIANDLKLYSDKVIRSYLSFIPIFDYLHNHPTPTQVDKKRMKAYYYQAQLFNWYRSQTDNVLDTVHIRIRDAKAGFPKKEIQDYFVGRDACVIATPDFLRDIRLRFIILNLAYVETFGTSPFNVKYKGNEPHIDHIYPSSKLKKVLGLSTPDVNFLGNYRFVGATDNIRKRAELPAEYFGRLQKSGIDISKHLLVEPYSKNPELMLFDKATYRDFIDKRFKAICDITAEVVNFEG